MHTYNPHAHRYMKNVIYLLVPVSSLLCIYDLFPNPLSLQLVVNCAVTEVAEYSQSDKNSTEGRKNSVGNIFKPQELP